MWKATIMAAALALGIGGMGVNELAAQGNGNAKGRASDRFERRDDRGNSTTRGSTAQGRGVAGRSVRPDIYDDDRDDRYDDRYDDRRDQGPAFCRSGAGHPVHGRQWCYDKGYGLGNDRWGRAGWDDVVLRRPDRRYEDQRMNGSALEDILGSVVYRRLNTQARSLGSGALTGRWMDASSGPRILQVHAGSRPLAEFYDRNRDGRVDLVMLNRGR